MMNNEGPFGIPGEIIPCLETSDQRVLSRTPLVSVHMITYNHAPYIVQAIEGVLQQKTDFPIELIIGEDCSTDLTREIVLEYQKKYPAIIRVLTSEQNVGMHKNARRVYAACRGEYMAFCEGDDHWHHPEKLQRQIEYLECHPECGMVSSDCDIYHNGAGTFKRRFNYNKGFQSPVNLSIELVLWLGLPIWTCTVTIRRHLYGQIIENDAYLHGNSGLPLADFQVWAEMAAISEVTYIPDSLATYRVLEESASRTKDIRKHLKFMVALCDIKLYLCNKYKLSEHSLLEAESDWCNTSLWLAVHSRDVDLAKQVMNRKRILTWKQWLRYFSTIYVPFNYAFRAAYWVGNVGKKQNQWP